MNLRKYIRRNMYRWHRIASLIIALPVLLWAISGFMHPLMTNIRPQVATQRLSKPLIDTAKLQISLSEAFLKNHIDTFSSYRLVAMNGNWFYQVKLPDHPVLKYYSAGKGKPLPQGDELYARYLAKQFLEGDEQVEPDNAAHKMLASLDAGPLPGSTTTAVTALEGDHDCCTNTMASIMNISKGAKVSKVDLIEQFDGEYKYVNRYLPAYKVSFDRADGVRIYVETAQDRFAFAVDDKRAAFDSFFSLFHTLSWLDFMGKGKHVVEILIMLLAIFTTIMGLYMFFTTKTKKAAPAAGRDLMKSMRVPPPNTLYVRMTDYTLLPSGEEKYARYLAARFSRHTEDKIVSTAVITKFEGEYGFVNKRLPVWKVGYAENSHERYYVETSTGKLAALVNDNDLAEGYSFALFHKHHFMDWGGKIVRDISTMFWALIQVLMVLVGGWFWMKKRKASRVD
ncbi:hypothetical protein [Paraflavitalea speifideaquila]|uniref:hypothetical protein n=1 Tax=Paraflavitalea speifideaquila TaxID=3076558 RepID=UPI0028E730FA|nr:hypothetical protein [Paraflavitalea speifideiaquila]